MPLFQDFGKRVSRMAHTVGQKTAEATEVARLNNRISARESEIEQLFLQIGKAYYAMRGASGVSEAADLFCQKVTKLEEECETLRKQIDVLRKQSRCPNCGGVQPIEAAYCASCGTKLPTPVIPDPEPAVQDEPESAPEEEEPVACDASPDPSAEEKKTDAPQSIVTGAAEIFWPAPSQEKTEASSVEKSSEPEEAEPPEAEPEAPIASDQPDEAQDEQPNP